MRRPQVLLSSTLALAILFGAGWLARTRMFVSPPTSMPEKTITVRVGTIDVLSALPLYVALDEGYFADEKLSVTLTRYRTSDLTFEALLQEEVDIVGCAGLSQALLSEAKKRGSVRLLGLLYSATCLLGPRDNSISDVRALQGKNVGCFPGSVFETYAREALRAEGLDVTSITITPLPPPLQVDALRRQQVDALFTLEPIGAIAVAEDIGTYITQQDLLAQHFLKGAQFPGGVIAIAPSYDRSTYGAAERYERALRHALADIASPGFDASPYLERYTQIKPETIPRLKYEGASLGDDMNTELVYDLCQKLKAWDLLREDFDPAPMLGDDTH